MANVVMITQLFYKMKSKLIMSKNKYNQIIKYKANYLYSIGDYTLIIE